jgi:uncharacterized protein YebE (UPF0316 family)
LIDLLTTSPWLISAAIFFARILDVSLGTLRTILVFRSYRLLAAALGFLEVVIWVVAAGKVLQNLDEWYLVVAFAGGFAVGNVVGIWLEAKLAVGFELVRAISRNRAVDLAGHLRAAEYSVVELAGENGGEAVEVLLVVARRRRIPELLSFIRTVDPEAVCTVSDVRHQLPKPDSLGLMEFLRGSKRR